MDDIKKLEIKFQSNTNVDDLHVSRALKQIELNTMQSCSDADQSINKTKTTNHTMDAINEDTSIEEGNENNNSRNKLINEI